MQLHELPVEVLISILESTNSLADLGALANTSRRIYSIFRNHKASLVYQALATELGPVMADALGLSDIEVLDGSSPTHIDQLEQVLSTYSTYLADQRRDPSPRRRLPLEHVLRLARSYRVVAFVANVYLTCTLDLLDREIRPDCPHTSLPNLLAPPSDWERLRIVRAHYRLQMMLHMWSSRRMGIITPSYVAEIDGINMRLFGQWEPWELQQIFCVGSFYQRFRRELANAFFDRTDPRKPALTSPLCWLDVFWAFSRKIRTADEAVWKMAIDRASRFPTGRYDAAKDEERRSTTYRHRVYAYSKAAGTAERHSFPVGICFDEDHVSTIPFGWVDAFAGYYGYDFLEIESNIRRREKPTQGLWVRLAFVMWDAPRVQALKTSCFLSECEKGWARSWRCT